MAFVEYAVSVFSHQIFGFFGVASFAELLLASDLLFCTEVQITNQANFFGMSTTRICTFSSKFRSRCNPRMLSFVEVSLCSSNFSLSNCKKNRKFLCTAQKIFNVFVRFFTISSEMIRADSNLPVLKLVWSFWNFFPDFSQKKLEE